MLINMICFPRIYISICHRRFATRSFAVGHFVCLVTVDTLKHFLSFPFRIMKTIATILTVAVIGILNLFFVVVYIQKLPPCWWMYTIIAVLVVLILSRLIYIYSVSKFSYTVVFGALRIYNFRLSFQNNEGYSHYTNSISYRNKPVLRCCVYTETAVRMVDVYHYSSPSYSIHDFCYLFGK